MTLAVPLVIVPGLENIFETPKHLVIFGGALLIVLLWIIRQGEFRYSGLFSVGMAIAIFSIFSLFYTKNPYYTKHYVILNLSCLAVLFAVSQYGKRFHLILFGAIALAGLWVSVETICQYFGIYPSVKWPAGSLASTIGNPNYIGSYLIFPIFAMLGLAFIFEGRLRIILSLLSLFPFIALYLTRARSGWLAIAVSLPLFFFMIFEAKGWRFIRGYVLAGLIMIFCAVSVAGMSKASPVLKMGNILNSDTFRYRLKYFRASTEIIKDAPLLGQGIGSFRNLVYDAQSQIAKRDLRYFIDYPDPKPRRVHNDYLETLVDGGIVYFIVMALFMVIVLKHGIKALRNSDHTERAMVISAMASLVASMVSAIFFFQFRLNSNLFIAVVMMGIIEGVYLKNIPCKGWTKPKVNFAYLFLAIIIASSLFWTQGITRLLSEKYHYDYRVAASKMDPKGAEENLLKAIYYDPDSSMFNMSAAQFYRMVKQDPVRGRDYLERVVVNFNGDLTLWSVYWIKGLLDLQEANVIAARASFYRSLRYFPFFEEAFLKAKEMEDVIKNNDSILVRLR